MALEALDDEVRWLVIHKAKISEGDAAVIAQKGCTSVDMIADLGDEWAEIINNIKRLIGFDEDATEQEILRIKMLCVQGLPRVCPAAG